MLIKVTADSIGVFEQKKSEIERLIKMKTRKWYVCVNLRIDESDMMTIT